jgi:nitrogen regulatory protein PII
MVSAVQLYGDYEVALMKIIEAVIMRSNLNDFSRCVRQLGVLGFDLSEEQSKLLDFQRVAKASELTSNTAARLKIDFAVLDEETKPVVHAVLESVHPESIGIFKFDADTRDGSIKNRSPVQS